MKEQTKEEYQIEQINRVLHTGHLKTKLAKELISDLHKNGVDAVNVDYDVVLKLIVKHYKVETIEEKMLSCTVEYLNSPHRKIDFEVYIKKFVELTKEKIEIEKEKN